MPELIASDSTFSGQQLDILRLLVDMMIPAEDTLPSAADGAIFPAIVVLLAGHARVLGAGLEAIEVASTAVWQGFCRAWGCWENISH